MSLGFFCLLPMQVGVAQQFGAGHQFKIERAICEKYRHRYRQFFRLQAVMYEC